MILAKEKEKIRNHNNEIRDDYEEEKKTISANKDNESEDKKKITIGSDKLEDMLNDNFIKKKFRYKHI